MLVNSVLYRAREIKKIYKDKNKALKSEIIRLNDQLEQYRDENSKLKYDHEVEKEELTQKLKNESDKLDYELIISKQDKFNLKELFLEIDKMMEDLFETIFSMLLF